ncbi:hypothetical protein GQ56_0119510 [Burkholderia paludis]|uniref:hypothetical protein n=1 Tax=Burkholderia paludis TaxID=1506587 RepID=UPI0004DB511E|nr:hypothetical protein [Burkholderia paludis]KFG95670.1 hypothetical protein GQ56_0119510 [Burkholderia paludis]
MPLNPVKTLLLLAALIPASHAIAENVIEYPDHNEYVEEARGPTFLGHDGKTLLMSTYSHTYTFRSTNSVTPDLRAIGNPDMAWRPYVSDIQADATATSFSTHLVICFGHLDPGLSSNERQALHGAGFSAASGDDILCKNVPMTGTREAPLDDAALDARAKRDGMDPFSIGQTTTSNVIVRVPDTATGKAVKTMKAPFNRAGESIGHAIAPFGLMFCKGSCGLPGG